MVRHMLQSWDPVTHSIEEECSISGCSIPFEYQDTWHYNCITTNHDQPWCATDSGWQNCCVYGAKTEINEQDEFNNNNGGNGHVRIDGFSFIAGFIFCIGMVLLIRLILQCIKICRSCGVNKQKVDYLDSEITALDTE
eukprot:163594_1